MKRLLTIFFLALVSVAVFGQGGNPQIPAYNKAAPPKSAKLPPILPEDQLWVPTCQYPVQQRAYILAAHIGHVLYHQPPAWRRKSAASSISSLAIASVPA